MSKSIIFVFLLAVAGGGWFVWKNYQIDGLDHIALKPRDGSETGGNAGGPPPAQRRTGAIRIATFQIDGFDLAKIANPRAVNVLAEVIRRFDVVAVQGIQGRAYDVLPRFVQIVNEPGRHYDFVVGRAAGSEQYAFLFDTASIEVDHHALYSVSDPDDLLRYDPLVGWFRVRGPAVEQAFTFTLVNVCTDPEKLDQELGALDKVYRAVRDDGRGEDDVILLGNLNVDDRHVGPLGQVPQITAAISGLPSNTRGDQLTDNLFFRRDATAEFTGRAGVLDLIREFNLTTDEALEVSSHLPVWAEFSIYEGGQSGRLAQRPQ